MNGGEQIETPSHAITSSKFTSETFTGGTTEPITDVTSGIAPIAPFLENIAPTDTSSPPHDLGGVGDLNSQATSDHEMVGFANGTRSNVEQYAMNGSAPEATQGHEDPSSRTDDQLTSVQLDPASDSQAQAQPAISISDVLPVPEIKDQEMPDAAVVGTKIAREREDDEYPEPSAKRARTEDRVAIMEGVNGANPPAPSGSPSPKNGIGAINTAPAASTTTSLSTPTQTMTSTTAPSTVPAPLPTSTPAENGITQDNAQPTINFGPMTDAQNRLSLDGLKNIRKSKLAAAFQRPVDVVALKIPTYLDVIKQPMDLSTMEQKLKTRQYASVNDYIADFDTMVQNSITFNGAAHIVSQNGTGLRATLNAQLKRIPRPGQNVAVEPSKKSRKPSVSIPREPKPPRAPRPAAGHVPPPPLATDESFALDADGMPQIRRHSSITDGRPKREIHKPPPKDLPYAAKPKRKKYQLELKFCQEVLDEITRPAYANSIAAPFLQPVDPVALNIPNYRSIIKKPMDFGTMRDKLATGNYENAKEFEADAKSVFANCYRFNGREHVISKMASDLETIFDQQMQRKSDWIAKHAPPSAPQSPEIESEVEEDEEDEEDDDEMERQAKLSAVHAQFAQLSAQLLALQSAPPKRAKSVGKKAAKAGKGGAVQARRKSSMSGGAALPIRSDKKSKNKAKSLKPVTTAQKEEISEKIGQLTTEQMGRAAEIIKASLRKAGRGDLAVSCQSNNRQWTMLIFSRIAEMTRWSSRLIKSPMKLCMNYLSLFANPCLPRPSPKIMTIVRYHTRRSTIHQQTKPKGARTSR